ncbi:MAG: peptide deformylase [Phycisphaerae bacterium]
MSGIPVDTPTPETLQGLHIVLYPDPVLRAMCVPVDRFDPWVAGLAERMLGLMHEAHGVGLAAPQVGIPVRLFVCNTTGEPGDDRAFVNPRFVELTGAGEAEEGCLSLPDVNVNMRRAVRAVIEASDVNGRAIRATGEDLTARVWQHERDHLDGRLIVDRMSTADAIANRRVLKQLEANHKPRR